MKLHQIIVNVELDRDMYTVHQFYHQLKLRSQNFDRFHIFWLVLHRNDKGDYYSYHQNKWQLTELPIEQTRIPVPWCGSLKSTYSTRRCDFQSEMALAEFFRSYVLFTDGSLHLYTKLYGAFHVTGMLSVSLIIGMIIGGVMGRNTEYK